MTSSELRTSAKKKTYIRAREGHLEQRRANPIKDLELDKHRWDGGVLLMYVRITGQLDVPDP